MLKLQIFLGGKMTEFTQKYQKFFDEFEKAYKEYENKVKERRARGIHDYNVFDVLETKEVKHSKFIASLLDPKGLHYQGDLFLREFVNACGISDFGLDTSNAQVFREYENIDIYITDGNKHIIIENKICDAKDQDKQIYRYIETIKNENSSLDNDGILVLYLTPNFDKTPSQESLNGFEIKDGFLEKDNDKIRYKHIVCDHILKWLDKIKIEIVNLTDLNVIITQYEKAVKNLINKGEKMENENLIELVKQNYKIAKEISKVVDEAEKEIINEFFKDLSECLAKKLDNCWCIESLNKVSNDKFSNIIFIAHSDFKAEKFAKFCIGVNKGYDGVDSIEYGFTSKETELKSIVENGNFAGMKKHCVKNNQYARWAFWNKLDFSADICIKEQNSLVQKIAQEMKEILKELESELVYLNKEIKYLGI